MLQFLPVLVGFGALIGAATIDFYASKYDHIDVDTILNNRRMVNYYAACMLSKGPCPPEGLEFKRILPDALRTNCVRCTEKQKTVTLRAIRRLKKEYPKIWAQLAEQWDPDGIYISKFESTFATFKPAESSPEASVQIINRFGDGDNQNKTVENAITQIFTTPLPSTSTKTTTTATATVSTKAPITKTTTRKPVVINTTNKPNINTILANTKPTKRPRPIRPGIGASIQATVEVVKSIEKVVSQIAWEKLEFISRLLKGYR
ncbi:hypothetical protein NQ315_009656 [Exocentrus adspersus]|uniref:Uncharacterized protein n=1 Tax=Exocentrus adspersus TaxID=1586481 RepID=A0AAV8WHT5_9CUCU|nr:hypothetical protein NQ315_009656 [Exocentrus adspersus]